jgi:hypothetical protein
MGEDGVYRFGMSVSVNVDWVGDAPDPVRHAVHAAAAEAEKDLAMLFGAIAKRALDLMHGRGDPEPGPTTH